MSVTLLVAFVLAGLMPLLPVPRRARVAAASMETCPRLVPVWRRLLAIRLVALVIAFATAALTSVTGELGQGLAMAPATFAVVLVTGVMFGEFVVRVPGALGGSHGVPVLPNRRRLVDYVPRGTFALVLLGGLATAAFLTWTSSVAVPDDAGLAGRAWQGADGLGTPFPGSYYTGPIAGGIMLLVAMVVTSLLVVARRLRIEGDAEVQRLDDLLRLRTCEGALASAGVGLGATLAGSAAVAAERMLTLPVDPSATSLAPWVAWLLMVAGAAMAVWGLAAFLVPGSRQEAALAAA